MPHLLAASNALPTDEWLMGRYYAGEDDALEEIDRRHRARLELHVLDRIPPYLAARRELAQELVGETILKVVRTRRRPRARWNPMKGLVRVWLRGILKNQLMSVLRVRKGKESLGVDRRMVDDDGREIGFEDQVPDHRASHEARFLGDEQIRQVFRAIDGLPDDLRTIVRRKFLEHRSHEQIGAEFGVSVPTVSRRLTEAKIHLRRALDAERREWGAPSPSSMLSL